VLAVQLCGIIGLIFAHATMQPQARAARQIARLEMPKALILLPFGNDGVGVPGPFIAAAPGNFNIELIRPDTRPDLSKATSVILPLIRADGASSASISLILAGLQSDPCWAQRSSTPLFKSFIRTCRPH
jgi:hypothetical protein